jgi:hypothetical protein
MIRNHNWYNLNSTRHYPLDDNATGDTDDSAGNLPTDVLVDCNIKFPNTVGKYLYISSAHCTPNLVTLTFLAADSVSHGIGSASSAGSSVFIPVAVITVQNPEEFRPYPIDPLYPGVGGWVVFGDGVKSEFSGKFSTPEQTQLAPKVARWYEELPIPSIHKEGLADKLAGVVLLKGSNTVEVVKDTKIINGENKDVIAIRLKSSFGRNVLDELVGPCGTRPESRNCDRPPIEYINTVPPDCDGDITINFSGFGATSREFAGSSGGLEPYAEHGITLDFGIGIGDACTVNDRIPDEDGKLPNDYLDDCDSSISESLSSSSSSGSAGTGSSSSSLSESSEVCGSLPYGNTFDDLSGAVLSGGIPIAPKNWQVKIGTWGIVSGTDSWLEYQGHGTQLSSSSSDSIWQSSISSSLWSGSLQYYPINRVYYNLESNGQNVSLYTGCDYEALVGSDGDISRDRRVWADLMVPGSSSVAAWPGGSAGVCLNYRISPFSGFPHYIFVSLDIQGDRLVISRWAGNAYQELATGFPVSLSPDKWYRLSVTSEVVTETSTKITASVFDAEQFSTGGKSLSASWPVEEEAGPLKTVSITTASFGNIQGDYSYDGYAGVFARKLRTYFSHFNFDKDV